MLNQMKVADITQEIIELRPTLKLFTYRFTRDREESQDLLQDTLVKALTHKHKFREQTNLKGWLFTIMRNTFINNYRRRKRERTSADVMQAANVSDTHTFHSPDRSFEFFDIWKNVNSVK